MPRAFGVHGATGGVGFALHGKLGCGRDGELGHPLQMKGCKGENCHAIVYEYVQFSFLVLKRIDHYWKYLYLVRPGYLVATMRVFLSWYALVTGVQGKPMLAFFFFFFFNSKEKQSWYPFLVACKEAKGKPNLAFCFFFFGGGPLKKTCSNCTMSSIQWPAKVGRLSARFLLTNQRLRVGFTLAALLGS